MMEVPELEHRLKRASSMSHAKKYSLVALLFCWLAATSGAFKSVDLRGSKAFQNAIGGVVLGIVGTGILAIFIVLPAFVVGRAKDRSEQRKLSLASDAKAFEKIGFDGFTELMYFAGQGDIEKAKNFLDSGLDINAQDVKGGTALLYAVMNAQKDMASLLIARGADPSIAATNGLTARHIAEKKGIDLDV